MASAAPGTPKSNPKIKSGSNNMFSVSPKASSQVGVRLSPNARMRLACMEKSMRNGALAPMILMNVTASSKISGGVCMRSSTGRAPKTLTAATVTPMSAANKKQAAALFRTPAMSRAP